jgi:hypothetical protein
MRTAMVRVGET